MDGFLAAVLDAGCLHRLPGGRPTQFVHLSSNENKDRHLLVCKVDVELMLHFRRTGIAVNRELL